METESLHSALTNRELTENVFVPRAFKRVQQLKLDEQYPYNPDLVQLNSKVRDHISNHYHDNVSYLDSLGHAKPREFLAQKYNVSVDDVIVAPTVSLARWYLTALFLDEKDAVACNPGLAPEYEKIKLECKYAVKGLTESDTSKVVAVRIPDVGSNGDPNPKSFKARDVSAYINSLTANQALIWEDPFALLPKNLEHVAQNYQNLPDHSPAYLLTSLTEVFLNDASAFGVIILLNNKNGKFNALTNALLNIVAFYFPPNSALHPLTSDLLGLVSSEEIEENFKKLESRKTQITALLTENGIKADLTPPGVWSVGVARAGGLAKLLEKNRVLLPPTEYFRTSDFVYVSVLHETSKFQELITLIKAAQA